MSKTDTQRRLHRIDGSETERCGNSRRQRRRWVSVVERLSYPPLHAGISLESERYNKSPLLKIIINAHDKRNHQVTPDHKEGVSLVAAN